MNADGDLIKLELHFGFEHINIYSLFSVGRTSDAGLLFSLEYHCAIEGLLMARLFSCVALRFRMVKQVFSINIIWVFKRKTEHRMEKDILEHKTQLEIAVYASKKAIDLASQEVQEVNDLNKNKVIDRKSHTTSYR